MSVFCEVEKRHNKNIQKISGQEKQYDDREEDKDMTKKEIIDKVYQT